MDSTKFFAIIHVTRMILTLAMFMFIASRDWHPVLVSVGSLLSGLFFVLCVLKSDDRV